MYQAYTLSHSDAQAMIQAVRSKAESIGKAVCVVVADPHGELIAFLRMDGWPASLGIHRPEQGVHRGTRAKGFGRSRKQPEGSRLPDDELRKPALHRLGRGAADQAPGQVIGAIGDSGLSSEEDIELAQEAINLSGK